MKFVTFLFLFSFPLLSSEKNIPADYKIKLKSKKEFTDSFKHLDGLLKLVNTSPEFTLYEALPYRNKDLLQKELQKDLIEKRYEFFFYKNTVKMKEKDLEMLKKSIFDKKSYSAFRGFKKCGGYKPTFSLYFHRCDVEVHICLGCHEAKFFHKGKEVYCNYSHEGFQKIKDMLYLYRVNSPRRIMENPIK